MKMELISDKFRSDLKEKLLRVLNGDENILEIDSLNPCIIIDCLKELGVSEDLGDAIKTNGWQWDYWINFYYNEKKYCISGSGYYGELKLYQDNDADEEYIENKTTEPPEEDCISIAYREDLNRQIDEILKNS